MKHPLLEEAHKPIRQRVLKLLGSGFSVPRASKIIFVCGGNEPHHMRPQFLDFCLGLADEFDFFKPEYAITNLFADGGRSPFNIAEFENFVGEIAQAIIIFPEAPGSFAETGYFSAIKKLAEKTILVMDNHRQNSDSFISIGPAKLIADVTHYHPNIWMEYKDPDFNVIIERLKNRRSYSTFKALPIGPGNSLSSFEFLCLIQQVVQVLRVCTLDDVQYILRPLLSGARFKLKVWQSLSMLVGSGHIKRVGDYGHFAVESKLPLFLKLRDGFVLERNFLAIEIAGIFEDADNDFKVLVDAA